MRGRGDKVGGAGTQRGERDARFAGETPTVAAMKPAACSPGARGTAQVACHCSVGLLVAMPGTPVRR